MCTRPPLNPLPVGAFAHHRHTVINHSWKSTGSGFELATPPPQTLSSRRVVKVRVPPRTLKQMVQFWQAARFVPPVVFAAGGPLAQGISCRQQSHDPHSGLSARGSVQSDREQYDGRFQGFDVVALRRHRDQITWTELDLRVTRTDPDTAT